MADRGYRRHLERLRWVLLLVAVALVTVFLVAQRQSSDVRYGDSASTAKLPDESGIVLQQSAQELTTMLESEHILRLPGATATWDAARVAQAIGANPDVRILATPPGLAEAQRDGLQDVAKDKKTILVVGTRVTGDIYEASSGDLDDWRGELARADVTGKLVVLIDELVKNPKSEEPAEPGWRAPTDAELAAVATDLRTTGLSGPAGLSVSADATLQAFGTQARYLVLPVQPGDRPAPDYGPALTRIFPDTPIVVMYGYWIAYYGPHAADFADVAAVSFYARFGGLLGPAAYPQQNVLNAWLGQVTTLRNAGLFDRPLPYRPFDPLRVALPVLPWLFAVCVAGFLALSVRSLLRPGSRDPMLPTRGAGLTARLAGLTALAVEVSPLTDARTDPALTRAIGKLDAARSALDERLPDRQVRTLLDEAEQELDRVGRALPFAGYRPSTYLRGRLA